MRNNYVTHDELEEFLKREAPSLYAEICDDNLSTEGIPPPSYLFLNMYKWFIENGLIDINKPLTSFHDTIRYYMDHVDEFHFVLL